MIFKAKRRKLASCHFLFDFLAIVGRLCITDRVVRSWVALLFLLLTPLAHADYVYTLIDASDALTKGSISLKSTVAPSNGKVVGKGTLHIERKDQAVLKKIVAGVSVDMTIDVGNQYQTANGDVYYRITGGWFTLDKDVDEKDPLKIGLGIKLPKDTKFSAEGINNATQHYCTMTPPAGKSFDLIFPFMKDDPSGPTKVTASTESLSISKSSTTGRWGVEANGKVTFQNVNLAGISIPNAELSWKVSPGPGGEDLSFEAASVTVAMDLPGTSPVESNKLLVTATNLKIDQDGEFSFSKIAATPTTPIRIDLANPSNFAILLNSLTLEMDTQTNEVSNVSLKFDLELPAKFRALTGGGSGNPAPLVIKDIDIQWAPTAEDTELALASINPASPALAEAMARRGALKFPLIKEINKGLNKKVSTKFGDFKFEFDSFTIDLDAQDGTLGGSPSWVGIYIPEATLTFSSDLQKNGQADAVVTVKDFTLGSAGIDGQVTLDSANVALQNFKPPFFKTGKITSLSCEFLKGQLVSFDAQGSVWVDDLKTDLNVGVTITGAGVYTLKVDPAQSVSLGTFGNAITMSVDEGTYTYDAQQNLHKLKISGVFGFNGNLTGDLDVLSGLQFGFQDLSIDSTGKFALGGTNVDLPNPVKINLGPAKVEIAQFGIVSVTDSGGTYPGIILTGDVSVEDLPVSGTIGFDGITVYYTGSTTSIDLSKLKADWKKINLDLSVAKVGRLTAELEKGVYPDASTGDPVPSIWNGKSVRVIRGSGSLTLDCFGSGSMGIGVQFMSAPKAWFVSLDVDPPTPITLGSTGLQISRFRGGLGRNVTSPTGDSGMVGVPIKDYKLVPLPEDLVANTPNYERKWLFTAGIRIETVDRFTMWGDLNLTAGIGEENFFIDLDGKFYFLEKQSDIDSSPNDFNRRLLINLHYNSAENSFRAYAQADLYFPKRQQYAIYAYAPVELYLSPKHKFFRIGGDVTQNPGGPPSFTNPATVQLLGGMIGGNGVFLIDLDRRNVPAKLTLKGGVLVWYNANLSFDITSKIRVEGWVRANGYAYFDGSFKGDESSPQSKLEFDGANAQVGFGVSIGGTLVNPIKNLSFTASADADLTGKLSNTYAVTLTGTLSGRIKVGKFNPSFRTGFTIQQ